MAIRRSAMGKSVDMSALQARNERVRAVGNMDVNARGDTIDSSGKIIKPVTAKVNQHYSNTVGNKPAPAKTREVTKQVPKIQPAELTESEKAMEAEFDDDELVEQIKALENQQKLKGKK